MNTSNYSSVTWLSALLVAAALGACGGGGGSAPDASSASAAGTSPVPVAAIAPVVVSTSPVNAATGMPFNSQVSATFSAAMNAASLVSPATAFRLNEAASGNVVAGVTSIDATGKTAIFTPAAILTAGKQYTATITNAAKDQAGTALAGNVTWIFTAAAPAVSFTFPNDASSVLASLNTKIVAGFNTPIKQSTLASSATAFTIKEANTGTQVAGTVAYDAASRTGIFTITPPSLLSPNTRYIATITAATTDENDTPLEHDATWSFTTGTTSDTIGPMVAQPTSPLHAETGVVLDKVITITFNEPMDPTSITAGTFQLFDSNKVSISGFVALDVRTNTAAFTPKTKLAPNAQYTVSVFPDGYNNMPGAKDLAGNPLTNGTDPYFDTMFYTGAL